MELEIHPAKKEKQREKLGVSGLFLQQAILEARLPLFPVEVSADGHDLVHARHIQSVGRSM